MIPTLKEASVPQGGFDNKMTDKPQCPYCGCRVFESLDNQGWRVMCSTCDYSTVHHPQRYAARATYRNDFSREFKKGITPVDAKKWQARLDNGELYYEP